MAVKVRGKVITTSTEREEILSDNNPNTVERIYNVSVQNMDYADVHFIFNGGDEILVEAGEVLSLGDISIESIVVVENGVKVRYIGLN